MNAVARVYRAGRRRLPLADIAVVLVMGAVAAGFVACTDAARHPDRVPHQSLATLAVGLLGYLYFRWQQRAKQVEERSKENYRFLRDFSAERPLAWDILRKWHGPAPEAYRRAIVDIQLGFRSGTDGGQETPRKRGAVEKEARALSLFIRHFGMMIDQNALRHDLGFDNFYSAWRLVLIPVLDAIVSRYKQVHAGRKEWERQKPLDPLIGTILAYDRSITRRSAEMAPLVVEQHPIYLVVMKDAEFMKRLDQPLLEE